LNRRKQLPDKTIDTLVADIYGMFDGDHFPHDPKEFVKFGKNVEELFHDRFNTVRGKPTLRMSNMDALTGNSGMTSTVRVKERSCCQQRSLSSLMVT
jgi:hypothetical protein